MKSLLEIYKIYDQEVTVRNLMTIICFKMKGNLLLKINKRNIAVNFNRNS